MVSPWFWARGELPLRVLRASGGAEAHRLRLREDLGPVHPHVRRLRGREEVANM